MAVSAAASASPGLARARGRPGGSTSPIDRCGRSRADSARRRPALCPRARRGRVRARRTSRARILRGARTRCGGRRRRSGSRLCRAGAREPRGGRGARPRPHGRDRRQGPRCRSGRRLPTQRWPQATPSTLRRAWPCPSLRGTPTASNAGACPAWCRNDRHTSRRRRPRRAAAQLATPSPRTRAHRRATRSQPTPIRRRTHGRLTSPKPELRGNLVTCSPAGPRE